MKRYRRIILLPMLFVLLFASCSKKATESKQKVLKPGIVEFKNQSGLQVRLDSYTHKRNHESVHIDLFKYIENGTSYTLRNMIEGGASFKGGDIISIEFRCYFQSEEMGKTITLTVDGDEQITILKRCTYDIG